jgi:hypothetical protein
LSHHANIIPIRKVLGYLAFEDAIHMDVLNLEGAPGGLHADQHPAIDRKARHAPVRTAVCASDNDPLALGNRVQNRQARVGEVGLNFRQHFPHASTPYLSAVVSAVLGEAARRRVEVTKIERFVELFGYSQVGSGDCQGSPHPLAATPAK